MNSESPRQARAVATEPGLHQVRHIRRECRLRQVLGQRLHGHHESSQHERGKGVPLRKRCGFATPNPAANFPQPNGAPWADSVPLIPHQRSVVLPTTRAPIFKRTTVRWTCLQRREQPDEGTVNDAAILMSLVQTRRAPRLSSAKYPMRGHQPDEPTECHVADHWLTREHLENCDRFASGVVVSVDGNSHLAKQVTVPVRREHRLPTKSGRDLPADQNPCGQTMRSGEPVDVIPSGETAGVSPRPAGARSASPTRNCR